MSGSGGIAKIGTGTLFLANTGNSYSGGTALTAGTVSISSINELGTGPLSFNGGVLQITGSGLNDAGLSYSSSSSNWAFDIPTVNSFTLSDNLSGTGSMSKFGGGTLVLNGTNTYTGGTSVLAGAAQFSASTRHGQRARHGRGQ